MSATYRALTYVSLEAQNPQGPPVLSRELQRDVSRWLANWSLASAPKATGRNFTVASTHLVGPDSSCLVPELLWVLGRGGGKGFLPSL